MMFPFFALDPEAYPLLGPGSELATPSDGHTFESGAGVLVSEDNVDVGSLLLIAVHRGSEAAPLGVGVGALEWGPVGCVCSPSLRPAEPRADPMGVLSVRVEYKIPAHLLNWAWVRWKEEGEGAFPHRSQEPHDLMFCLVISVCQLMKR